jgi:hypothetical protein
VSKRTLIAFDERCFLTGTAGFLGVLSATKFNVFLQPGAQDRPG